VDLYIDSPFPVYVVSKLAESPVLVDRWKKGQQKYHSILFTKKGSPIKTLDDLKGQTIAFESPYSTSGYFLPKAELLKRGYSLREKTGPNDVIGKNEIGYYFTNNQEQVVLDVLSGKALIGGQNQVDVEDAAGDRMSELTKLFQSIDVYRHIIVTRKDLSSTLRDQIKNVMVNMDKTAEGQVVLKNFKKTAKLVAPEHPDDVFQGLAELTKLVENEIIRQ
jgi:phosphonate transport system substrate-binding protein